MSKALWASRNFLDLNISLCIPNHSFCFQFELLTLAVQGYGENIRDLDLRPLLYPIVNNPNNTEPGEDGLTEKHFTEMAYMMAHDLTLKETQYAINIVRGFRKVASKEENRAAFVCWEMNISISISEFICRLRFIHFQNELVSSGLKALWMGATLDVDLL